MKIEIEIGGQMEAYFESLIAVGLYGSNAQEAAITLIRDGVIDAIAKKIIPTIQAADKDNRLKCTNCGSPNLEPFDAMGSEELHCKDCNWILPQS